MNKLLKITAVVMMLAITFSVVYTLVICPKEREDKLNSCIAMAQSRADKTLKSIIMEFDGSADDKSYLLNQNTRNLEKVKKDCFRRYPIK